jgi:Domain of unknown function (DUF4390)
LQLSAVSAEGISVRSAGLELVGGEYQLYADFLVDLGPTLEDALNRGVPLHFVLEFYLWRPRRWWFDEQIAHVEHTSKLSYNSLTRQYRVSSGALHQNFPALDDAKGLLSRVRGLAVAESAVLKKDKHYQASVRMWLDVSQLPKPFQLNAVTDASWNLISGHYVFDLAPNNAGG